jgi:thioesterase domain-containing protein/acyl carrier protein
VAQLTQRTNQFNFTTLRRSESEVQQLSQSGVQCRIVEVSDRFGDYGLVGVLLFSTDSDSLKIDTFLLSCRVLGRGVEHEMMRHLAEIAAAQNLQWINAPYHPTPKNLPALNFLESVAADYRQTTDQGYCFQIPVEQAQSISYTPGNSSTSSLPSEQSASQSDASKPVKPQVAKSQVAKSQVAKSQIIGRIAKELFTAEQILASIQTQRLSSLSQSDRPIVFPRTTTEQQLAGLWTQVLSIAPIGITDNFFDLGGTSLQAVTLFAQIERTFGKAFPLTTLLEAPTIEQLACLLDPTAAPPQQTPDQWSSLVPLNNHQGSRPLFLMHTGRGEILLYRNLAQRLQSVLPVYALKPYSDADYPILHTRIEEMAAFYVQQIRTIQPEGPYLLGGFCAGGVIAVEMARQLQRQGHQVGLIALIDSGDPQASTWHEATVADLLNQIGELWRQNSHRSWWQQAIYTLKIASPAAIWFAKSVVKEQLQQAKVQIKVALYRYYLNRRQPRPSFLKSISIQSVYNLAAKEHRPKVRFQGDVLLLRTVKQPQPDHVYTSQYFRDPLLGWERRVTGTVKTCNILGDSNGMLHEPYVAAVAEKLQASIEVALGQHQLSA